MITRGTTPTIRPEASTDFERIDEVVADAFGSPAEAELVRRLRSSDRYRNATALVAVVGDEVVGHVMTTRADVIGDDTTFDVSMLSPLAVAPSMQRRGIGRVLVHAVCAIDDANGDEVVLLQGDPQYYGSLGFEPSDPLGLHMDLPDWAPREAAQARRLSSWSGQLRGHLELPPAFDGLD